MFYICIFYLKWYSRLFKDVSVNFGGKYFWYYELCYLISKISLKVINDIL